MNSFKSAAFESVSTSGANIIVVARVRPLNKMEEDKGARTCVKFDPNKKDISMIVSLPKFYLW